jgi:hypothetical protein
MCICACISDSKFANFFLTKLFLIQHLSLQMPTYHDVFGAQVVGGQLSVEGVEELHALGDVGGDLEGAPGVQDDAAVLVQNLGPML